MPIDHRRLVTAGKRLARVAGGLYLLSVALGGIAHLAVRAGTRVPGNAATTAPNIAAGPTPAPVSLAADLALATMCAFVGVTAYLLLRRIDRRATETRVVFVAVGAGRSWSADGEQTPRPCWPDQSLTKPDSMA